MVLVARLRRCGRAYGTQENVGRSRKSLSINQEGIFRFSPWDLRRIIAGMSEWILLAYPVALFVFLMLVARYQPKD